MGLPAGAFIATMMAALLHACWNAAARHAKGDLRVSIGGFIVGLGALATPAGVSIGTSGGQGLGSLVGWGCVVLSAALHAAYIVLLNTAYRAGGLSVVYPVARGTGVATATLLAGLWLGEEVNPPAYAGVGLVLVGIVLVSWCRTQALKPVILEDAADVDVRDEEEMQGLSPPTAETFQAGDETLSPAADPVTVDEVCVGEPLSACSTPQADGAAQEGKAECPAGATKEPEHGMRGVLVAVATGITIGSYSVVDKVGVAEVPPLQYLLFVRLFVLSSLLSLSGHLRLGLSGIVEASKKMPKPVIAIGLGGTGAYGLVLWAMTAAHATYVVALRESSVVFGAIIGWTFFKEPVSPLKILGVCSVVAGVITIRVLS
eukprot:TRINITY_DN1859_c0_g1_i2.p1 TRINITY_DN1859_c0_g1~~TRINITY_DN1859_c0_g1_i2.p1  ORF type:complete len:395 (+),score=92.87 TRINITY_DN1859_c0_g1_i2:64-1185(+)